jgi:hypothetical protein
LGGHPSHEVQYSQPCIRKQPDIETDDVLTGVEDATYYGYGYKYPREGLYQIH